MHVKDLMLSKVELVAPGLSVRAAAQRMRDLGIGCLPVSEGGRLLGILTDRDIACRVVADGDDADATTVGDVMTSGVVVCFEDQNLLEAAAIMRDRRVRRLLVLSRDEIVVGILSVDDLCAALPDPVFASTMKALVMLRETSP